MAATTGMRKSTSSINDYPEHLNPFHEDDNHNKIRFWTIGRKANRSNSFSLNNIKDFRNTWSLKSFMKKNKKGQESQKTKPPVNGEASPIVYRRANQYGWAAEGSPPGTPGGRGEQRYVYGGSVTPLPRSRFQERMRSTPPPTAATPPPLGFSHMAPGRASYSHRSAEPYALPGLTRGGGGDVGGSRLSVTSVNPFDGEAAGPVPAARRKKKRAAPLPPQGASLATSVTTGSLNLVSEKGLENKPSEVEDVHRDVNTDDPTLNIELKIVEDIEDRPNENNKSPSKPTEQTKNIKDLRIQEETRTDVFASPGYATKEDSNKLNNNITPIEVDTTSGGNSPVEIRNKKETSIDLDDRDVLFEKVNIREYRRNSSFNSDQITMSNGNTEASPLNNKRCKSLSNTMNTTNSFTAYDITLHIDEDNNEVKDLNDNEAAPQKVVCKMLDGGRARKASVDNSISSTEKEFIEIDRATRHLEQEINKLNSSVKRMDDDHRISNGKTVSEMKSRFENPAMYSPNPIPKPRRSRAGSISPVNP